MNGALEVPGRRIRVHRVIDNAVYDISIDALEDYNMMVSLNTIEHPTNEFLYYSTWSQDGRVMCEMQRGINLFGKDIAEHLFEKLQRPLYFLMKVPDRQDPPFYETIKNTLTEIIDTNRYLLMQF